MKNKWFYIAIVCLGISVLSFLISIVSYRVSFFSEPVRITIIDVLTNSDNYSQLARGYNGPIVFELNNGTQIPLAVIAIVSVICSGVGLFTLRTQRPNTIQFVLTVAGLIGVSIPAIVIMFCVFVYGEYYSAQISLGLAPIITPVAMVISIFAVMRRRNVVLKELYKEVEKKGLIRQASDL